MKSFSAAKERLTSVLDAPQRRMLAQTLAEGVIRCAAPMPVTIVCDDREVADWATDLGVAVVWAPGRGLDRAVASGVAHLASLGFDWVTVAHADLPFAESLSDLPMNEGVTIVPDRHNDGTNVITVPSASGFTFSYGPGSFQRHTAEADRLGLPLLIVHDEHLGVDVDVPEDLDFIEHQTRLWGPEGPHTPSSL